MQMRRKPVVRTQPVQQLGGRLGAQPIVGDFVAKVRLEAAQLLGVAVIVDAARPIVRRANVEAAAQLLQPEDVQLPHVVDGFLGIVGVRCDLVMALVVVVAFEDACEE